MISPIEIFNLWLFCDNKAHIDVKQQQTKIILGASDF